MRRAQSGISLVEMLVALSITAYLVVSGVPSLMTGMANSQIRTTAEAIASGLQLARVEALRRNLSRVRFQLTSTVDDNCALSNTSGNWVVSLGDNPNNPASDPSVGDPTGACGHPASDAVPPYIIQTRSVSEGGASAVVAAEENTFVFDGLGRLNPEPTGNINIDISNPKGGACIVAGGEMRCLRVTVSPWGEVRVCDPSLTAPNDPQGCG